jgi:hypothetical protein
MHSGRFTVWYLLGARVVAALTSGRPDDLEQARNLITAPRTTVGT